ncbi:hypothetical protein GCM10009826_14820 [Humibacillus xanthopallidus]
MEELEPLDPAEPPELPELPEAPELPELPEAAELPDVPEVAERPEPPEPPEPPAARAALPAVELEEAGDDEAAPDGWVVVLAETMVLSSRAICVARPVMATSAPCWARDTASIAAAQERSAAALGPPPLPVPWPGDPVEVGPDVGPVVGVPVPVGVAVGPLVGAALGPALGPVVGPVVETPVGVGTTVVGAGVPVGCACECGGAPGTGPADGPDVAPSTGAHTRSSVTRALCDAKRLRWTVLALSCGDDDPPEGRPVEEPPDPVRPAGVDVCVVPVPMAPPARVVVGVLVLVVVVDVGGVAVVVVLADDAGVVEAVVEDADPSAKSDASSWARLAWAESRLARSAVGSMAARLWPADTWSPTATCRAVTVPFAGKEAVTWLTRCAVPARVSTCATGPRVTTANR